MGAERFALIRQFMTENLTSRNARGNCRCSVSVGQLCIGSAGPSCPIAPTRRSAGRSPRSRLRVWNFTFDQRAFWNSSGAGQPESKSLGGIQGKRTRKRRRASQTMVEAFPGCRRDGVGGDASGWHRTSDSEPRPSAEPATRFSRRSFAENTFFAAHPFAIPIPAALRAFVTNTQPACASSRSTRCCD